MAKTNSQSNNPIIAIVGPTASGKTAYAIKLAKKLDGFIISADSRQIYQHAHIGTAQPDGQWRGLGKKKIYLVQKVPHFFIDFLSPNKYYSVVKYQTEVKKICHQLSASGYLPILVGGTGLYVSAIVENYNFPTSKPNLKLRKKLENQSTSTLLNKLKTLDPNAYNKIDKHNRRRIIRALEHIITTGTAFYNAQKKEARPNTLIIGLRPSKTKLLEAIKKRTKNMIRQGLLKETFFLKKHYPQSILLKTIGYQEMLRVLDSKISPQQVEKLIVTRTWQYARRQMTWFKKRPNIHWVKNFTQSQKLINEFLNKNAPNH